MTEALRTAPQVPKKTTLQLLPSPIFEIPDHLTRSTLRKKQRENGIENAEILKLWEERGIFVEKKVQSIIASQTQIVASVDMHPAPDTKGSDLTVKLLNGLKLGVEVKSSSLGIRDFKHKIRDKLLSEENNGQLLGPWAKEVAVTQWNKLSDKAKELAISRWLTQNNLILINGGQKDGKEKTPEEILSDSFYPQLERILQKNLEVKTPGALDETIISPKPNQIQIFPEISA